MKGKQKATTVWHCHGHQKMYWRKCRASHIHQLLTGSDCLLGWWNHFSHLHDEYTIYIRGWQGGAVAWADEIASHTCNTNVPNSKNYLGKTNVHGNAPSAVLLHLRMIALNSWVFRNVNLGRSGCNCSLPNFTSIQRVQASQLAMCSKTTSLTDVYILLFTNFFIFMIQLSVIFSLGVLKRFIKFYFSVFHYYLANAICLRNYCNCWMPFVVPFYFAFPSPR